MKGEIEVAFCALAKRSQTRSNAVNKTHKANLILAAIMQFTVAEIACLSPQVSWLLVKARATSIS
jgi:hypothetical protein